MAADFNHNAREESSVLNGSGDHKDDPSKVIDLGKKRKEKAKLEKKVGSSRLSFWHYLQFFLFLGLVAYLLRSCGA